MALLGVLLLLVTFGWVMVYSTTAVTAEFSHGDQYYYLKRQVAASAVGVAFLLAALRLPFNRWQKLSWVLYALGLAGLLSVLFIGREVNGARRWLRLGPVGLQPSEPAKLFIIFALADFLDRNRSRLQSFWRGFVPAVMIFSVPSALILLEPDMGTAVLAAATGMAMVFLAGARGLHCAALCAAGAAAAGAAIGLSQYRSDRMMFFLNPWKDPLHKGYQLIQSLLAIGSGGIFGQGLGNSQLKLHYLPDAHTDFIFSIVGEETGLLGTLFLVALFAALAVRGFRTARLAPHLFATLTASGIVFLACLQALVHFAVSVGLAPTKGIPLPFLSYGGSSLVAMLFGFGIVLNISRHAQPGRESEGLRDRRR